MTVGETLTEARTQAGLSVDELSERTRIRETVIRSIERDDYDTLGGDIYVRGYVRAIAGAVGIDAQPLIHQYDLGRAAAGAHERANGSTGKHALGFPAAAPADGEPASPGPAAIVAEPPAAIVAEPPTAIVAEPPAADSTRFDLPAVSEDPAATRFDLLPVPADADGEPEAPVADGPPAVAPDLGQDLASGLAPDLLPPGDMAPETAAFATLAPVPPPPPDPLADTRYDLPPVTDDLMAAGYDLNPEPEPEPAAPGAAADQAGSATAIIPALGPVPGGPDGLSGPDAAARPGGRRSRRSVVVAAAVAVVVVAGAALGISMASGGTSAGTTAAPAARASAASGAAAQAGKASAEAQASASASRSSASASASAQTSQKATAKAAAVVSLPLASARAYGPDGFGDGDNPGNAQYTIASHPSQEWATQWYVSADFGKLKHGTGLLIDLGRQSTVAGIRLGLSQFHGANVQIRVGNGTAPSDLRLAAATRNAGGVVRLALRHPAAGRYVLIWITKLPPDGAGHYQESVSNVMISGHR